MTTTPYLYQVKAARKVNRFSGRCLVAGDPGVGKTLITCMALERLADALPAVVVCPAHLKWHWEAEAKKHIGLRSEILEGTTPSQRRMHVHAPITIVNYDILGRRRGEHNGEGWLDYLRTLKPQTVILDESHFLASRVSLRSKACRNLCQDVPYVLALTGTPIVNRPAELWTTLNILRPDLYPSWWKFGHRFCAPYRSPWGWKFEGASHLDELHDQLESEVMVRIRRGDVLAQIPRKRRILVPLPLADRHHYERAMTDFLGWLADTQPDRVRKASKAEAMTKLTYVLQLIARLKMPAVGEWLDSFLANGDDKINVFGIHVEIVRDNLYRRYRDLSVIIDGKVGKKDRHLAVEQFVKSDRSRVLFGNIRAGGTGWSATGVSKTAFVELEWAPGHHEQAEDRTTGLNRGKEDERSENYYLLGADTIETDLWDLLVKKSRTASAVLDGERHGSFDVADELIERLLKRKDRR